jgi:acyl-CoA synthetase (AMP-forming)/AMP-acid ligase II
MIVSGGENVYPAEIEAVLMGHPEALECAVIGVPDAKWGETVKACGTPAGTNLDETVLIEWSRDKLAGFKRPRSVDFVDSLPRNASGKLPKRTLREAIGLATGGESMSERHEQLRGHDYYGSYRYTTWWPAACPPST